MRKNTKSNLVVATAVTLAFVIFFYVVWQNRPQPISLEQFIREEGIYLVLGIIILMIGVAVVTWFQFKTMSKVSVEVDDETNQLLDWLENKGLKLAGITNYRILITVLGIGIVNTKPADEYLRSRGSLETYCMIVLYSDEWVLRVHGKENVPSMTRLAELMKNQFSHPIRIDVVPQLGLSRL